MQLPELTLRAQAGEIHELQLLSLEGGCYLLDILTTEGSVPLLGSDGRRYRFGSTTQARRLLAELPAIPCFLIQHSAYDEMIGLAPAAAEPLKLPLSYRTVS